MHFVGAPPPLPVPGWAPPPWWEELTGRRVVVVTQGSAMADPAELLRPALAGLAGRFPDRPVGGIAARAVVSGGGACHYISQQQPEVVTP